MTLFEEIKQLDSRHLDDDKEIRKESTSKQESLNAKKQKGIVVILVTFVLISIALGIIVGQFIFVHKIYGAHTTCYTTDTGKCYHSANCGYLWHSSHKTTVYKAERRGYVSCSQCSVGMLDESEKHEYGWGILVCLLLIVPPPVIIKIKEKNRLEKQIEQETNNQLIKNDEEYKNAIEKIVIENGVLKIVNAPSEVMYQGGNIVCNNEKYYRYTSMYGNCYHSNPSCGNRIYQRVWAYNIIGLSPCSKCAQVFEIPEWYLNFIELSKILKKYKLIEAGAKKNDYR